MQVQKLSDKITGKRKQIRTANLSQTAKTTDYSAYTSLRSDLERLLALMEAMVIRSSTADGRCSIKLSLLCESTVPVGEAPVQRQTPVRNTEYVCGHVCRGFDPRSANQNLDDTIARITASVKAMTNGGKSCKVHVLPLPERGRIKMADGTFKSPSELTAPPPLKVPG